MKTYHHLILSFILILILFPKAIVFGEDLDQSKNNVPDYPKIGLALSGGGAKGFVHIGVINVLEEVGLPIDYITGTSMGALIGGLYSIGYSTEELTELALTIDWEDLFTDTIRRRNIPMDEKIYDGLYLLTLPILNNALSLPSGVVAGQRIGNLLGELTWDFKGHRDFSTFPIPFACAATDIETGDLVVLRKGHLTDAIRASISIPSALMPHRIDGKLLVDGGVVRNLPVEEAFESGANFVIAVDVVAPLKDAEELRSILDILDQTVTFQVKESVRKSRALANLIIESDSAKTFSVTDFSSAKELIALGESAAREHYDFLKELAESIRNQRGITESHNPVRPITEQRIHISDIEVVGNKNITDQQIKGRLLFQEDHFVSRDDIVEGIESVYGMMFFDSILYRLIETDGRPNSYKLFVEVNEKVQNQFRFGFSYNNIDNASLLINTSFRNILLPSSVLRLSLKLAEEPYFDVNYFRHLDVQENLSMNLNANYSQRKIDLFNASGNRVAQYTANVIYFEGMLLPVSNNHLMGGIGLRQEIFNNSSRVGDVEIPGGTSSITQFFARLMQDNLERLHFPKRGHQVFLEASQSVNFFNNSLNFFQAQTRWYGYFQINDKLTLLTSMFLGIATRSELPLHKQFYLGGYPDLVGFRNYELGSYAIRKVAVGGQFEFMNDNFFEARLNAASDLDLNQLNFNENPLRIGWSIGYGLNTLIGPIRANITGSQRNPVMVVYSIGANF